MENTVSYLTETRDAYFNNLKERYSLYSRHHVDPKIDVAETGGSPFQDFKEFLGFEKVIL